MADRAYFSGNTGNRSKFDNLLYGLVITRQVLQSAVTVNATATKIPTTPIEARHSLLIFNNSSQVIYVGSSTVTTLDGWPVYPHQYLMVQIEDGVDLYGISAAGGNDVRILEGA